MGTPMNPPNEQTESEEIEFTPPADAELKGDKGTASINWRRKSDGTVCITAINGVSLGADNASEERDEQEVQPVSDEG